MRHGSLILFFSKLILSKDGYLVFLKALKEGNQEAAGNAATEAVIDAYEMK